MLRTSVFIAALFFSLFNLAHSSYAIVRPVRSTTITVAPGAEDYTSDLKTILANAPNGATIRFMKGTYTVAKGTTYVVYKRLNLVGSDSTLVNAHFLFLANVSVTGMNLNENDCFYKSTQPAACPVYPPMIGIGAINYPITQATVSDVTLNYSRAYTGISFGTGPIENVSINNFSIIDNELSGITALGGSSVTISNGTIRGSSDANVDDGIALYSAFSPLINVTISNITTNNTFDAVGIGTLMYYPMHDIVMNNTICQQTAVCIYVKAGDVTPVPSQYSGYSTLDRFTVNGVTDTDVAGVRHLSTIWIYAKGGATASNIVITNVNTSVRSLSQSTPHIWLFTDKKSKINNTLLADMNLVDEGGGVAASKSVKGQPAAEGLFLEDQGESDIETLALDRVTINGTAYYAVDSSLATVNGLSISGSVFKNIDRAQPTWSLTNIPYEYLLNGQTVNK